MKILIKAKGKDTIYDKYRNTLKAANLSIKQIDEMRPNLRKIAEIICEHVWEKKFY